MLETLDTAQVVRAHFVAGGLQVRSHRASHGAKADERELHGWRSAKTSLAISAAVPAFGQPQ